MESGGEFGVGNVGEDVGNSIGWSGGFGGTRTSELGKTVVVIRGKGDWNGCASDIST